MRPCSAVLLTPLECAVPGRIPISIQSAPGNPLESALTSHSQPVENTATLSLLECALTRLSPATPLESALTKNRPVGEGPHLVPEPATHHLSLAAILKFFLFTLLRTLLRSPKTQPFSFQALPHSLPKTTRGGGVRRPSLHFSRLLGLRGQTRPNRQSPLSPVSTFHRRSKVPTLSGLSTSSGTSSIASPDRSARIPVNSHDT